MDFNPPTTRSFPDALKLKARNFLLNGVGKIAELELLVHERDRGATIDACLVEIVRCFAEANYSSDGTLVLMTLREYGIRIGWVVFGVDGRYASRDGRVSLRRRVLKSIGRREESIFVRRAFEGLFDVGEAMLPFLIGCIIRIRNLR
jgi:hypothetical protein